MAASTSSNTAAHRQETHAIVPSSERFCASSLTSPDRWFLGLATLHLLIWTVVAGLTQPNAPLDVVEMIHWGNEWQWGYYKHPPLPAWIAAAVTEAGGSLWPLYLVSQLFIVSTFWVCWRMARTVLEPWSAVAAVAVLEFCVFYNYASPEFNNNIPPKLFWALTIVLLYFAMLRNERTDRDGRGVRDWRTTALWAGTGASIGLSLLSKYDAAILVLSMLAFALAHPRGRAAWKTPGPWITAVVALAIFLPHAIWMWQYDFLTLRYFGSSSEPAASWLEHLTNPLEFIAAQTLSLAGVLVVLGMLFRWRFAWSELTEQQRFARSYLAFAVLGPLFIVVAYSLISGGSLETGWGASMWTFLPLLLMLCFQFDARHLTTRRLVRHAMVATCVVGAVFALKNVASPYLRSKPSRVHFPGRELAAAVQRVWSEQNCEPLKLVGGDWWYAGNAAVYAPRETSVYTDMLPEHAPWTSDDQLNRFGGVILWPLATDQDRSEMPESWKQRFPRARPSTPLFLPWQTAAPLEPLRVGIAIIHPIADQRIAADPDAADYLSEKQR